MVVTACGGHCCDVDFKDAGEPSQWLVRAALTAESTTLAPLSSEDAAVKLRELVQSTIDAGATVVLGGDRPDREGAYFNPTILTDITPDMPTYDQELFGPIASVYVVKDEAAAIVLANDSSYGLGGSVFTSNLECGRRVSEQVETGMMFLKRIRMQGFIVRDHLDAQAEFIADMALLIKAKKIVWEETIADGLENSPSAFIGLFDGDNLGKQLVRIR